MERSASSSSHRIQWYRFPAAPLMRVHPSHFLLGLQSLYLFPYRAAGLLVPAFHCAFLQCSTDDPSNAEASTSFTSFHQTKRGYLLCIPRSLNRIDSLDGGEFATVGAIAFRKQCLLWCLVRYVCSKNCMLSAPKQRLDSLTGMTPMVFTP